MTFQSAVARCTLAALVIGACVVVAAQPVRGRQPEVTGAVAGKPVAIKILGFNDFHGQISAGRRVNGRPAGGAAVFAAYLKAAMAGVEDSTIIANAGDNVGASPLASALLRDEPTLAFINMLGNRHCSVEDRDNPRCNLIGTPGNHELDRGREELLRQIHGGNHRDGPFLQDPWRGVNHAFVSANLVDNENGKPLFAPYQVKQVRYRNERGEFADLQIGFIGALLRETPNIVPPDSVAGLRFLDEAEAINRQVAALKAAGVRTIVVLLHQGGFQTRYRGATAPDKGAVSGRIGAIVGRLDPEVDVVLSGHTHAFTNALISAADGSPILVTQAFSSGTAYADIDLEIDPATRDVVARRARIVTTYADAGPGLHPDAQVARLVARAEAAVAPLANRVVGRFTGNITRATTASGESALGNLIADAQRVAMKADFAFMNRGGLRADLRCAKGRVCDATYADLFAVQPLGNTVVRMQLTGEQIYRLLEQQFPPHQSGNRIRFLQVSGLSYSWDANRVDAQTRVCNACVVEVRKNGAPIERGATYTVAVNSFLAAGGDRFSVFDQGAGREGGPPDVDALADYFGRLPQPVGALKSRKRIVRLN